MATTVLTLTDFLLARIAEDEAVAHMVAAERARVAEVIGYPVDEPDGSFWADFDGAGPSVSVGPHRILAECAAKRRFIERHPNLHVGGTRGTTVDHPCESLRDFAAMYADHPDYRDEWRP